jgi:cysteine desulfurase family protein
MQRIYLDNAATSWPKPEAVYAAVDDWQRRVGSSYARGTSAAAEEARGVVDRARRAVATLLGESDPRRVIFTSGGTEGLNLALFGLLRPGDHVVATVCEHNAVLRPLNWLSGPESLCPIEVTWVDCDAQGFVTAEAIAAAIRPSTRLVAMIHASNVTGAVQPVEAVGEVMRQRGVRLVVDAAQSIGKLPIDVNQLGADIVVAPGHKGLLGPQGTGVVWLRPGVEDDLRPLKHGGAASGGELAQLPSVLPDRFEAGSPNLPGIAGLAAGVEHVLALGVYVIHSRLAESRRRLAEALGSIAGVRVYGPDNHSLQAGVVCVTVEGYDPQVLASLLARVFGVESRAGLHCAPRLHQALGTLSTGGLVRFSPGLTTTVEELDAAVEAVAQLAATPPT